MALPEISIAQFRTAFQNAGDNAEAKTAAIRAFASAITDILFNNFEALREALGIFDGLVMYNDAKNVVANELHKDAGNVNRIVNAIKEDALQAGGDKDYAIDIGV